MRIDFLNLACPVQDVGLSISNHFFKEALLMCPKYKQE
jgi:hypothetical protein